MEMPLKRTRLLAAIALAAACLPAACQEVPAYKNLNLSFKDRAADLVSRMTLEEKVSQMCYQETPAIERLGVPAFNYGNECLHGILTRGVTSFPQAIGMAASWDTNLMLEVGTAISDEARAKFHHDGSVGITYWSPNINIFRDPRWGRGQETYGEDPYLTSRMAVNYIKGLQGNDPVYLKCVATPKHFAVHSGPDTLRTVFDVSVTKHDLWDTYLPAFEACVREAKAGSVMGAYQRLFGVPCCGSTLLLQDILRKKWGFDGYVVSDCGAIELFWQTHKVVSTPEQAGIKALLAGCDIACCDRSISSFATLATSVKQGLVSEQDIDKAVIRLMTARMRLGLFDPPEKVQYTKILIDVVNSPAHRQLARQAARESIVLLKNEGSALPLDRGKIKTLAVVGPLADKVMCGDYSGEPVSPVSILQGIKNAAGPGVQVNYAAGQSMPGLGKEMVVIPTSALSVPGSDEHGLRGDYFDNSNLSGAPVFSQVDPMINMHWGGTPPAGINTKYDFAVRWTGKLTPPVSGKYVIEVGSRNGGRLYIDDKLVVENWSAAELLRKSAKVDLKAGKSYNIKLEYNQFDGDAQIELCWTVPGDHGDSERLQAAVDAVKNADAAVVVLGIGSDNELEARSGEIVESETMDRGSLGLPESGQKLLEAVCSAGKPIALVLVNGSALSIPWAAEHVPAILDAWYPSEEGGNAVAEVLFGDYSPAGRLPVTVYQSEDQLPDFKDYRMDNRTYRYFKGTPLFPFGFGLSYCEFAYSDLKLNSDHIEPGSSIIAGVLVQNNGKVESDEVAQAYLSYVHASARVPVRKLIGFRRIHLQPGENKLVNFEITPKMMSYVDDNGDTVLDPGEFLVTVGGSQGDERSLKLGAAKVLREQFQVVGNRLVLSKAD